MHETEYSLGDIVSQVTGKRYSPSKCVYIKNPVQSGKYIKNHRLELLDLIVGADDKLIFVFDKEKSRKYYDLWLRHELE